MTVIDQIFHKVAEIAIPHFFITVEFSASGTEMPEHIEAFLQENTKQFFVEPVDVNLSIRKESGGLFSLSSLRTES